jgi:hypothetical protein
MRWAVGALAGFVSGLLIGGVAGWTAGEWLNLADDPALASLGRAAARAATGGAPVAATLARLARDQRRTARAAASARARTAGIRAVAPLGLCFLPAFIILGIVPAIAGMARNVLIP